MKWHKYFGIAAFICMMLAMFTGFSMVKGRSEDHKEDLDG